jgi:hypothetical protein
MMSEPINELQKQTFRYYYEDGLVELAVGILFAVIGLNTWLISVAPQGTILALGAWILLPILTVGGIFWVQRFVKNLKERLVYPRTGYIEYSTNPNPYRWLVMGTALLLALVIFVAPYSFLNRESVAGGTILFIILVSIGAQVDLRRLIVIGALALILGISLAFLPGSEHAGLSLTYAGAGLALIASGAIAFRKYLAENPQTEVMPHD